MADGRDIVYLSNMMWDEYWGTFQQIAQRLRGDGRILYVEGNYSWGKVIRRLLGKNPHPVAPFGRLRSLDGNFHVLTPPPRIPLRHFFRPLGVLNQIILLLWVRSALRRLGMKGEVLITYLHQSDMVVKRIRAPLSVYYCVDHWSWLMGQAFLMGSPKRIDRDEAMTARAVDVVLCTARQLAGRMARLNPDVHYLPNAVDLALFSDASPSAVPEDIRGIRRPIVGVSGSLGTWSDLDLLREIAVRRPDWSLVFIGHAELTKDLGKVTSLPNVHFLGMKPRREVPSYLRQFDVCLVPFRRIPEIESISPLKIFEYLALGRPVVATRYGEIAQLGEVIYLAGTPDEFIGCIERALAERGDALARKRAAIGMENSWESRAEWILRLIGERLGGSAASPDPGPGGKPAGEEAS